MHFNVKKYAGCTIIWKCAGGANKKKKTERQKKRRKRKMDEMIMRLIQCQKSVGLLKHFAFSCHTRECKDVQFTAQILLISLQAASSFLKMLPKVNV